MSATSFAAVSFGGLGAAPVVGLAVPYFVIRGTYRHPVSGLDTELPAHQFVLAQVSLFDMVVSVGTRSDIVPGRSAIPRVTDVGEGPFYLVLMPADSTVRDYYAKNWEAWIDLDTGEWASPQPDRKRLERRNLYRIPMWTTTWKAKRGGFKEWVPGASERAEEEGLLERRDLTQGTHGSLMAPWHIPIDYGWSVVTVRHFYFDWGRDKQNTLPPGLFVDAVSTNGVRVGSGVAVRNGDGAARMLIEDGPQRGAATAPFPAIDFEFRAPKPGWFLRVDLTAPEPGAGKTDTRLVDDQPMPKDGHAMNTLPDVWHSFGQWCNVSTTSGKGFHRMHWTPIRLQLNGAVDTDVTVEFHLDDVYIADTPTSLGTNYNGVPALFDHYMKLLAPQEARPHLSDCKIEGSVLAAGKAYTVGAPLPAGRKRRDMSTRLIHFDGKLFDLRDQRMTGEPGRTACVGARVALHNLHSFADYAGKTGNPNLESVGFYQLHHIDVPGVLDPRSGNKLGHVLLFVSLKLDCSAVDPALVDLFYRYSLTAAAERWSQGSPGVSGNTKDYRVVAERANARDRVLRFRAYFGEVSDSNTEPMLIVKLDPDNDKKRSNTRMTHEYSVALMTYTQGSIGADFASAFASDQVKAKDSDGIPCGPSTFAHEMGHVFGLPDEYGETLEETAGDGPPDVLAYPDKKENMPTDYRPFFSDKFGLMNSNSLPRLRYYWHHVESLNTSVNFGFRERLILRHEKLAGSIEYQRSVAGQKHPYAPFLVEDAIPGAFCKCAVFAVGQDEAAVEAMFAGPGISTDDTPTPLSGAKRVDAVLVVRSKVRFAFDPTIDAAERRKTISTDFIQRIFDPKQRPLAAFVITGGGPLRRIAIFLQPHCATGAAWSGDDICLRISKSVAPPPSPFVNGVSGAKLDIDISQFDANCVLRAILGVPTGVRGPSGPAANVSALSADDFVRLASYIEGKLGGRRRVEAM